MFAIKSRAENWAAMPNATLETSDPKARLLSLFDHLNKTIFFNVDMRYKAVQGGTRRYNATKYPKPMRYNAAKNLTKGVIRICPSAVMQRCITFSVARAVFDLFNIAP
ncbi:MAG TPA: hypothetical protein VFB72_03195 [Verrucomicrobiae bacterium]|nr:hypothetical protein [Verrucomicrobiae bacterium]